MSWKHTKDSSKEITARGKIERSCAPHWEADSLHHRYSWYKVYITCSRENLIFSTTLHLKWTKTLPIILFIFLFLNLWCAFILVFWLFLFPQHLLANFTPLGEREPTPKFLSNCGAFHLHEYRLLLLLLQINTLACLTFLWKLPGKWKHFLYSNNQHVKGK